MDQRHAVLGGPFRDRPRPLGVDEEGEFALILGAVDRGVGRGVDDEIGPEAVELCSKRLGLRQIELRNRRRNDGAVTGEQRLQRAADLAVGSRQQYPHQTSP